MTQIQTSGVIRNRGQITIPEEIRTIVSWATGGSAVTISAPTKDQIIIQPYSQAKKVFDWKRIWRDINLARSYKGRYSKSLSKFITQDRENH